MNAIQPNPGGGSDAFVTKFDTNGNMVYSTYLGGSGEDQAEGIGVDSLGNVYVTGQTGSVNFPTAKPLRLDASWQPGRVRYGGESAGNRVYLFDIHRRKRRRCGDGDRCRCDG